MDVRRSRVDGRVRLYVLAPANHGRITAWLAGIDTRHPTMLALDETGRVVDA